MMSMIGKRSSIWSDMNIRGMSGKWKFMCDSLPLPKYCDRVFGPLVRLREEHAAFVFRIDVRAELLQVVVRLAQVFAARAFAFVEVRDGIEAQAVDAHIEPEIAHLLDRIVHGRIVEIQIRLMRIEAMPVVGLRDRIPGPVRGLEIFEDDARRPSICPACRSRHTSRARASPARRGATSGTTGSDRRND